jgi:hypothetical protein
MSTIIDIIKNSQHAFSSMEFAQTLDAQDQLKQYRQEFAIPARKNVSGENPILGIKKKISSR